MAHSQEHIDGITIKYKKDKNKCKNNNCFTLRSYGLTDVEEEVEMVKYLDENTEEDISYYDYEHEKKYYCDYCRNKITFKYNPYEIYYKYIK